MLVKFRTREIR